MTNQDQKSHDPVAYFAAVLAVVSLLFSVYQHFDIRRQTELAQRPIIVIEQDYRDGNIELKLVNHGLSPAVVGSFKITSSKMGDVTHFGELFERSGLSGLAERASLQHGLFRNGDAVPVSRVHSLLRLKLSELNSDEAETLRDVLRYTTILVVYGSSSSNTTWTEAWPQSARGST